MVSWGQITYGTLLTGLLAGFGVFVFGGHRRARTALLAGLVTAGAACGWNVLAKLSGAGDRFGDLAQPWFPASWKAATSGIYALAAATVVLGATLRRTTKAWQLLLPAVICGLAAFLIDVYLY